MEDDPLCGFDFSDEEESSAQKDRQAKLNQSEEAFQTERELWRPVCQTKQVGTSAKIKRIQILISQAARRLQFSTTPTNPPLSKEEALEIKAAAEERYYSRDFEKSLALARRALLVGDGMQPAEKKDLFSLQERCNVRLKN